MLSYIWFGLLLVSVIFAACTGNMDKLTAAAIDGASSAIQLCIGLAGPVCLWCGVMRVLEHAGAAEGIRRILSPILRRALPQAASDKETMKAVGQNVTANLLGLGNAATPAGLRAASRMGEKGFSDALKTFVLLNTSSIQLLPTTIAAVRSGLGASQPFDILPAVWATSAATLAVAMAAGAIYGRIAGRKDGNA